MLACLLAVCINIQGSSVQDNNRRVVAACADVWFEALFLFEDLSSTHQKQQVVLDSGFDHSCAHPNHDPAPLMSSSKPSGRNHSDERKKKSSNRTCFRTRHDHSCTMYKNRIIFPLLLAVADQTKYEIWGKLYYNSTSKLHVSLQGYPMHPVQGGPCARVLWLRQDTNPWPNRRSRLSYVLVHHSFPITSSSILVRYMMTTKAHISLYWWFSNFQNVAAVDP